MINRKIFVAFTVIILAIIAWFIISSLKSCNHPKPVPVETKTSTVISAYNPIIDSLAKENFKLKLQNDSLKELTYKLTQKRNQSKASFQQVSVNTAIAEAKKDTAALVTSLKKQVADCDTYMKDTDQQLTVQGNIIENQHQIIKNQDAQIDLFKKQVKTCADENIQLATNLQASEKQNTKLNAKLKLNRKVIGGVLAVAIIEGIIISIK